MVCEDPPDRLLRHKAVLLTIMTESDQSVAWKSVGEHTRMRVSDTPLSRMGILHIIYGAIEEPAFRLQQSSLSIFWCRERFIEQAQRLRRAEDGQNAATTRHEQALENARFGVWKDIHVPCLVWRHRYHKTLHQDRDAAYVSCIAFELFGPMCCLHRIVLLSGTHSWHGHAHVPYTAAPLLAEPRSPGAA